MKQRVAGYIRIADVMEASVLLCCIGWKELAIARVVGNAEGILPGDKK